MGEQPVPDFCPPASSFPECTRCVLAVGGQELRALPAYPRTHTHRSAHSYPVFHVFCGLLEEQPFARRPSNFSKPTQMSKHAHNSFFHSKNSFYRYLCFMQIPTVYMRSRPENIPSNMLLIHLITATSRCLQGTPAQGQRESPKPVGRRQHLKQLIVPS